MKADKSICLRLETVYQQPGTKSVEMEKYRNTELQQEVVVAAVSTAHCRAN
jgi:hypothetical protein